MHHSLNNLKLSIKHIVDSIIFYIFALNLNFTDMKVKYSISINLSKCKDCSVCAFSSECIFEDCPLINGFIFEKIVYG